MAKKRICIASGSAVLALCLAACLLQGAPWLFGVAFFEVRSGSMVPDYAIGDTVCAIIGRMPVQGEVAVFRNADGDIILHRAVRVSGDGIYTKGDANAEFDPGMTSYSDVIGTAVFRLPDAGGWLATGILAAAACLGASLLIMGLCLGKHCDRRKKA